MSKVFFDRTVPFFFSVQPSFDGIAVDVEDETVVEKVFEIRKLLERMDARILEAPAPERGNQALADQFIEEFKEIINGD